MDKILEEYLEIRSNAWEFFERSPGKATYELLWEEEAVGYSNERALEKGFVMISAVPITDSGLAKFLYFPVEDVMSTVEN